MGSRGIMTDGEIATPYPRGYAWPEARGAWVRAISSACRGAVRAQRFRVRREIIRHNHITSLAICVRIPWESAFSLLKRGIMGRGIKSARNIFLLTSMK